MTEAIRVVQYGLGAIGRACASAVLDKQAGERVKLVGAIDIHPELAGRPLSNLLDVDTRGLDLVVSNDARSLLRQTRPHVVLHTTGSFLERVYPQIAECLDAGCSVISSTEELFYPFDRHAQLVASLDELARERGVVLFATGVNPGFVMDVLALAATSVCLDIESIRIERVVDASRRREQLQRKIGAGISRAEFERRKQAGAFGHIGLRESALFVAHGLGWELHRLEESIEPVMSEESIDTPYRTVRAGDVAGIHHRVEGYGNDGVILELDLKMFVGASDPFDGIFVRGAPPIDLIVRNGIFGDTATVAALVNAVPLVAAARPGFRLSTDLPVPRAFETWVKSEARRSPA